VSASRPIKLAVPVGGAAVARSQVDPSAVEQKLDPVNTRVVAVLDTELIEGLLALSLMS
jgi:hypothetical protein